MGLWVNGDGLPLQYGPQKAFPANAGDYLSYGDTREIEVFIDLTTLTSSPLIQDMNTLVPAGTNVFIEQVEVVTLVGAATGTSFDVGVGYPTSSSTYSTITPTRDGVTWSITVPSVTSISDTAFVNAMVLADVTTAGQKIILNEGSTYAGGYIGSAPYSADTAQDVPEYCYITAKYATGSAFTTGQILVRIKYHGIGTITY